VISKVIEIMVQVGRFIEDTDWTGMALAEREQCHAKLRELTKQGRKEFLRLSVDQREQLLEVIRKQVAVITMARLKKRRHSKARKKRGGHEKQKDRAL
jgi:hypothetical protein